MSETYPLAGRDVRRVGFGAMQLPGPGVFGPPRDRDEAIAVLRRAVDLGVNHVDTAQFYGPKVANELIFAALHPYPDDLVVVSKVGAKRDASGRWLGAQTPSELRLGVEENLATLALDSIPVVNLRRHPDSEVDFATQLDAMVELRDEGLIGAIGISTVTLEEYRQATARTTIATVQNAYNLADRSGQDVFDACRVDGTPYVPYFPLGSAFRADSPALGNPVVTKLAERVGATPAQVALAWLSHLAPNVLLIPGTSSIRHLEENLASSYVVLSGEDLAELDAA
jgi:aryl-alcohol dehydrogenase-like predicted oxidoreductase